MRKLFIAVLCVATFTTYAQVGIGTTDPKGALDVVSTDSGLIVPRVANTSAVTTPAIGMIIYDISSSCLKVYLNSGWTGCNFGLSDSVVSSIVVLTQIGIEADNPDTVNSTVTVAQLGTILPELTGVIVANETAYQDYIDQNPDNFATPATQIEVQAMVDAVNAEQVLVGISDAVLAQIGTEADTPDTVNSIVTVAQLGNIFPALTDVNLANETLYQNYIDENPDNFTSPATQLEVQTMIDAVNAEQVLIAISDSILAQIGNEADDPDMVNAVVTAAQLSAILPALTGVDANNETAYQDYIDDNPNNFTAIATQAEVQAMVDAVNAVSPVYCNGSPTTIVDVVGANGATWMDRNLGATQKATTIDDTAAYGDLYQWGRFSDGHQCRTSGNTATPSTTATPGHGDFITTTTSYTNWITPTDDNLWQGVNGINNPCPTGYRIPTRQEWNNERLQWPTPRRSVPIFALALKLQPAGARTNDGVVDFENISALYWSSTPSNFESNTYAWSIFFSGGNNAIMVDNPRSYAYSVRCIKDVSAN